MEIEDALKLVEKELKTAIEQHRHLASAHEGYAVILEELDELKDVVFWGRKLTSDKEWVKIMLNEVTQIAAMAIRFMTDIPLIYLEDEDA